VTLVVPCGTLKSELGDAGRQVAAFVNGDPVQVEGSSGFQLGAAVFVAKESVRAGGLDGQEIVG
jgi:hypothetical protein